MPRIAVTGHMNISDETATALRPRIREYIRGFTAQGDVVGISCLARGADTVFAQAILAEGGRLEAILPSPSYRLRAVGPDHVRDFDDLLAKAAAVHVLPNPDVGPDGYAAANALMLDMADHVLAVWDGEPSPDHGGTAATVEAARARGLPVHVLWPPGSARV